MFVPFFCDKRSLSFSLGNFEQSVHLPLWSVMRASPPCVVSTMGRPTRQHMCTKKQGKKRCLLTIASVSGSGLLRICWSGFFDQKKKWLYPTSC